MRTFCHLSNRNDDEQKYCWWWRVWMEHCGYFNPGYSTFICSWFSMVYFDAQHNQFLNITFNTIKNFKFLFRNLSLFITLHPLPSFSDASTSMSRARLKCLLVKILHSICVCTKVILMEIFFVLWERSARNVSWMFIALFHVGEKIMFLSRFFKKTKNRISTLLSQWTDRYQNMLISLWNLFITRRALQKL